VNPLRGQNNAQSACDMGSFPHELSGYRHVGDDATRAMFESLWGTRLSPEPGLRIPNMLDAAVEGSFKAIYTQGEDILQSDPNTTRRLRGVHPSLSYRRGAGVRRRTTDRDRACRLRSWS
jgi:formate dehydrogenase major subunit